jgi:hypothetical protein
MASKPSVSISNLLADAASAGTLSAAGLGVLSGNLGAVVIAGAAGADLEDLEATEVLLVTLLVDASSSIHSAGLEDAVREGQRGMVDAFAQSREKDSVLLAVWSFNDDVRVHHSYLPVGDAVRFDASNYRAVGSTRLYDTWCDALAANVAYAQRLRDGGTPTRSVVCILTDGEDVGSRRTAKDCAALSKDVLASEEFVLAFVGVGTACDFRAVARKMGVPDGCIEVQASATPEGLRKAFRLVSQSAIRMSQGLVAPGAAAGFFQKV